MLASKQEPHLSTPLPLLTNPVLHHTQGNVDSGAAPAVLAAQGRTTMHVLFKHAGFTDASLSKQSLNTTGKLHIAITKAGHRNKPEFWVINSLLSGFIQMLCRYTLLTFIILNLNLTLRFPFAVHFNKAFWCHIPSEVHIWWNSL